MRAINHALTGAIIGLAVGEPVIALPAAFLSHFVCDLIPHHASGKPDKVTLGGNIFRNTLVLDAVLCVLLVAILAWRQPLHWQLAAGCAFLAASPDFVYIKRYIDARRHKLAKPGRFVQFFIDIQWFQRPIGAVVEVAWLIAAVFIIVPFLV